MNRLDETQRAKFFNSARKPLPLVWADVELSIVPLPADDYLADDVDENEIIYRSTKWPDGQPFFDSVDSVADCVQQFKNSIRLLIGEHTGATIMPDDLKKKFGQMVSRSDSA